MFVSFSQFNHFGHRHLEDNRARSRPLRPLETFSQPVLRPFCTVRDSGAELEAGSSCTNNAYTALSGWFTREAIPSHQWLGGKRHRQPSSLQLQ